MVSSSRQIPRGRQSLFGARSRAVLVISIWAVIFLIIGCGKDDSTGPGDNGTSIDTIPPAPITDLTIRTAGTEFMTLVWTAPGDDGHTGTASAYDLRYHTSLISNANWEQATKVNGLPVPNANGHIESFTVTQLACSTEYHFAVKAHDEVPNISGLSNCPTDITRQERVPPMSVIDLTAEAISDTEFLLTWMAPGDDGLAGTASRYDIRYSKFFIAPADWNTATQVDNEPSPKPGGETDSLVVSGMDPDVNYYFVLKTADEVPNESDMSNCCAAMAYSELLMVSPLSFTVGDVDNLTIVFRAESGVPVTIEIWGHEPGWWTWSLFQEVAQGYFTEGIHTVRWNLWSDIFDKTADEDHYEVILYHNDLSVAVKNFRVLEP
jgi:hypothetical protein